jgi:hypothetical protein
MAERVSRTTKSRVSTTRPRTAGGRTSRKTARPPAQPKTRQELGITEEQVRCRAYQIFLRRNGAPGDPFGDWILAEHELIDEVHC